MKLSQIEKKLHAEIASLRSDLALRVAADRNDAPQRYRIERENRLLKDQIAQLAAIVGFLAARP